MHRSGTSAITRCLRELDIELGPEFMPAHPQNPKGFWENPKLVEINEAILASLGLTWHSTQVLPAKWWKAEGLGSLRMAAREYLQETFGAANIWGFKDPRTSRLLPFWQAIFQDLGIDDSYVLAVRNPLSVARSLTVRDKFTTDHGLVLWLEYTLESLQHSKDRVRVVVDYDAMLGQPEREMERIARHLRLALPGRESLTWLRDDFLDIGLRHDLADPAELSADAALLSSVSGVYRYCQSLATDQRVAPLQIDLMLRTLREFALLLRFGDKEHERAIQVETTLSQQVEAQRVALAAQSQEVEAQRERLAAQATSVAELQQQVADDAKVRGELAGELSAAHKTVAEQEALLARLRLECEQVRAELDDVIRERERLSEALEREVRSQQELQREFEGSIRSRDSSIAELHSHILSLQRESQSLQAQISKITRSTSWRFLKPLRFLRAFQISMTRGWRLYTYRLVPGPGVDPTAEGDRWRSTGADPWLLLDGPAVGGWVHVSYAIEAEARDRSCLYVDDGGGFSESRRVWLPAAISDVVQAVVHLPLNTMALRIDPLERPGTFGLGSVRLRPLAKWQVALHFGRSFMRRARRQPGMVRQLLRTLRAEGIRGGKAIVLQADDGGRDDSYAAWVAAFDTLSDGDREVIRRLSAQLPVQPLISVLMPCFNTPEAHLRAAIESVRRQLYPNWELCVADDGSSDPRVWRILTEYAERDDRIKVIHRTSTGRIAAASNTALELVSGEFVALLDHDDELEDHALYMVAREINADPHATVIYSDEDKLDAFGARYDPYFKSDWNPDLFRSQNMINHLGVYRTEAVRHAGGFRSEFDGAQDYDLALRVTEMVDNACHIRHIPHVLYHWRAVEGSTARSLDDKQYAVTAARRAVQEHLDRTRVDARCMPSDAAGYNRVVFALPSCRPLVSVIIPTRNGKGLLEKSIEAVETAGYKSIELVIVDNQSDDGETLEYLNALEGAGHKVLRYAKPFNYSAINNFAVERASGEVLVFLNNDIEAMDRMWLGELVGHVVRPEVGAVGAALYYSDDTLQHGGVLLGLGGIAGHLHLRLARNSPGYFGRAALVQDLSAVTGACLATRRDVFEQVGGFDEDHLAVAMNDIDWCLRVRAAGYLIVWTPYARLYHHESVSRGYDSTPEKAARFQRECAYMRERWGDSLDRDPYYNPNLSLEHGDFRLAWPPRTERPWHAVETM